MQKFEVGQVITYTQGINSYTETITKLNINKNTVIVNSGDGLILWSRGYAVGKEIHIDNIK